MTTPDPPAMVCAPWCTTADVPSGVVAALGDAAEVELERSIVVASEVLYALSGRQWKGAGCERTVHATAERPRMARVGGHRVCEVSRLELPDYPVTAVTTVLDQDAAAVASGRWRLVAGRYLDHLTDDVRDAWPAGTYEISYTYGQGPPAGGVAACASYAGQLALARTGSSACRLPQRVQTVTRQNVSMVLLDPMEFLDAGRVGLLDVDQWIASVNPTGRSRRSAVWSPDTATRSESR